MADWICVKPGCGHTVIAADRPQPINWSDGHTCYFRKVHTGEKFGDLKGRLESEDEMVFVDMGPGKECLLVSNHLAENRYEVVDTYGGFGIETITDDTHAWTEPT